MKEQSLTEEIQRQILLNHVLSKGIGERIPTEKELAAKYSVSITTVRRAIERLEAEGKLQRRHGSGTYVADGHRHLSAALLVPEMTYGNFYQNIALCMEPSLRAIGIDSHIFVTGGTSFDMSELSGKLSEYDVIILCGYGATTAELECCGKPFMMIANESSEEAPYVGLDIKSAVRQCVNHLWSTGCRKIRLMGNWTKETLEQRDLFGISERVVAFRVGLNDIGVRFSPEMVLCGGLSVKEHFECLEEEFSKERPDAIICNNDNMALSVVQYLQMHGFNVPEEVSVIGCDNMIPVEQQILPLTTIDFRIDSFALHVAALIEKLLVDPEGAMDMSCFIRPRLVVRESTRKDKEIFDILPKKLVSSKTRS